MSQIQPVSLSIHFAVQSHVATMTIHNNNPVTTILTVLHEKRTEVEDYDIVGGTTDLRLDVNNGDSLSFVARREGHIVASAIYEVRTSLVETCDVLLAPHCSHNILCQQHDTLAALHTINIADFDADARVTAPLAEGVAL